MCIFRLNFKSYFSHTRPDSNTWPHFIHTVKIKLFIDGFVVICFCQISWNIFYSSKKTKSVFLFRNCSNSNWEWDINQPLYSCSMWQWRYSHDLLCVITNKIKISFMCNEKNHNSFWEKIGLHFKFCILYNGIPTNPLVHNTGGRYEYTCQVWCI